MFGHRSFLFLLFTFGLNSLYSKELSQTAEQTAHFAAQTYAGAAQNALAEMIRFKTVANQEMPYAQNPEFTKFRQWLKHKSQVLGLKYSDHGYVQIVSLGEGKKVLGLITHGDVQPANPSKWNKSPFVLDTKSEPGKLIGRGTEDDKGAIAAALYALKAIKDRNIPLKGKVELLIYMAEESDWAPLREFLKTYQPAPLNIAFDAEYPVVTAEKAWSHVDVDFPELSGQESSSKPLLVSFKGGEFRSQIPEDAVAEARNLNAEHIEKIRYELAKYNLQFETTRVGDNIFISAKGKAAHSSKPREGTNAIALLAAALGTIDWQPSAAANAVYYLSDLVGTGLYGEQFGSIAYRHDFMGPMTLSPTVVKKTADNKLSVFINIRRPFGKEAEQLTDEINQTLEKWQAKRKITINRKEISIGDPLWVKDAPHVSTLLNVFEHFTGIENPQPIAIGGSTNAKLFPNAVSFGPSMPGTEYTGHSEHEFITQEQFVLTIKMYTAAIIEIAGKK